MSAGSKGAPDYAGHSGAHTPGPWTATVGEDGDDLRVSGPNGALVIGGCGCCGSPFTHPEHAQANARLIAAAPDMLKALQQAEQQLDYGQIDAAHRIILAALAKVEARG